DDVRLGVGATFECRAMSELDVEICEWEQVRAQAMHGRTANVLDAHIRRTTVDPDELEQFDLRDSEAFTAGRDDQGGDDRECQRDLDPQRRAATGDALDVDRATDLLDVGLHDVHPDAA